jgi:hypothetical protein
MMPWRRRSALVFGLTITVPNGCAAAMAVDWWATAAEGTPHTWEVATWG